MLRAPVIFGSADGLTCAMGIISGLVVIRAPSAAVWTAALSAGLAEFPGMASGQYQSDPGRGKLPALGCGLASTVAAVAPAVPYLLWSGIAALCMSVSIAVAVCTLIAMLRPDTGWKAFAQSYGITAAAVALCVAFTWILPR